MEWAWCACVDGEVLVSVVGTGWVAGKGGRGVPVAGDELGSGGVGGDLRGWMCGWWGRGRHECGHVQGLYEVAKRMDPDDQEGHRNRCSSGGLFECTSVGLRAIRSNKLKEEEAEEPCMRPGGASLPALLPGGSALKVLHSTKHKLPAARR